MITLFRMIRLFQLKTKYRLAFWQLADKLITEISKNSEETEKEEAETEKDTETATKSA